ncbi:MAG: FkbM family methyltransferase [Proteobacteria bacterium]|nr:FkbM family methyltransferase [Pseudomonadota bacterium]
MVQISFSDALDVLVAMRDETTARPDSETHRFLAHCLRHAAESHGQFLQDLWVTFELGERRNGFFVEFGAADGLRWSNSLHLERSLGWNGILAEPAHCYYPALLSARNCFVDRRCVWTATGERLLFNQPAIAVHATIDAYTESDNLAETRRDGVRYEVETVSLNDLLAHWNAPRRIDYLSVDTEGSELDILRAFDFDRYDVRLISVEHNHTPKRDELLAFLTAQGYRRRFETLSFVDDWYVKTYD